MEFLGVGVAELIFIFLIAMMVFGPRRLPEIAGKIGRFVAQMRAMSQGLMAEWQREIAVAGRLEDLEQARKDIQAIKQDFQETKRELGQARKEVAKETKSAQTIAESVTKSDNLQKSAPPPTSVSKTSKTEAKTESVKELQGSSKELQESAGAEVSSEKKIEDITSTETTPKADAPVEPEPDLEVTANSRNGQPVSRVSTSDKADGGKATTRKPTSGRAKKSRKETSRPDVAEALHTPDLAGEAQSKSETRPANTNNSAAKPADERLERDVVQKSSEKQVTSTKKANTARKSRSRQPQAETDGETEPKKRGRAKQAKTAQPKGKAAGVSSKTVEETSASTNEAVSPPDPLESTHPSKVQEVMNE